MDTNKLPYGDDTYCCNETITNLYISIATLEKQQHKNAHIINILNNIIIENDNTNTNLKMDIQLLSNKNLEQEQYIKLLTQNQEYYKKYITSTNNLSILYIDNDIENISERSSDTIMTQLTKKQKHNKKKHERRNKKQLESSKANQITIAREKWSKENGYNPNSMGLEFI